MTKHFFLFILAIVNLHSLFGQEEPTQTYNVSDEIQYQYSKPKVFDLVTNIPKNYIDLGKNAIKPNGLKWMGITALATIVVMPADQDLIMHTQNISSNVGLSQKHSYKNVFLGVDYPTNVSATFYHFGHGNVSLLFASGFLATGLIKNDYRAIHTSIEIGESILTLGVMTQGLKRVFGRQSPNESTQNGGYWEWFPNLSEYMKHTPSYDAFPSGHLATLASTITVISTNYPEVRWIKPVGYSMAGLLCFEMMNSGVHWASDYPLGFLIGYSVAKVSSNRRVTKLENKKLSYNKTVYHPELMVTNFFGRTMVGVKVSF